ncbi:MAG: hypothetical protein HQ538_02600 [Parcubacteria group bacterium]|nr:hypothetical protein [Parcubacteria group bacterium]
MNNILNKNLIWVQIIVFLIIWAAILFFSGIDLKINWEAIKKLPSAVTIYILIVLVFIKWAWRLSIFEGWLVLFPNLQGTWKGTLQSTCVDPITKQKISSQSITLVIKQTFLNISCVMYADESSSFSNTAQINKDDDSGISKLSYNYTSHSKANVRDRSAIHDGAVILRVITKPKRKLEGVYWTSRRSTGDISVKFYSKELSQVN